MKRVFISGLLLIFTIGFLIEGVFLNPEEVNADNPNQTQFIGIPSYFKPTGVISETLTNQVTYLQQYQQWNPEQDSTWKNNWDQVINFTPKGGVVILNPHEGSNFPGIPSSNDSPVQKAAFKKRVTDAQARGLTVLGYVFTNDGKRNWEPYRDPITAPATDIGIKQDIDNYFNWYGVNGIFVDTVVYGTAALEVPVVTTETAANFVLMNPKLNGANDQDKACFKATNDIVYNTSDSSYYWPSYKRIYDYIKSVGVQKKVVLNPGVQSAYDCYMPYSDIIVNYEGYYGYDSRDPDNSGANYTSNFPPNPAWVNNYPVDRFWHLIHSAPTGQAEMKNLISLSKDRHAGYIYVTPSPYKDFSNNDNDHNWANPWQFLTNQDYSYWLAEGDAVSASFRVTNNSDSGPGSFRDALLKANSTPGLDTISFNLLSGSQTINLVSPLPDITDPVIVDGASQPGYINSPLVELSGQGLASNLHCLVVAAGNSTIRGMVINRCPGSAIYLTQNGGNVIQGNYLGTDTSGTIARPNSDGLLIKSSNNLIGGTTPGAFNLISGNTHHGIFITGSSTNGNTNVVQGNFVGTTLNGQASLGNGEGVTVSSSPNNQIGGNTRLARNLISGNTKFGIWVNGLMATGNQIQGNYIGTNPTGTSPVGNLQVGILVSAGGYATRIGGSGTFEGNLISGNGTAGITLTTTDTSGVVVKGNFIGTSADGKTALGNGTFGIAIGTSGNNVVGGVNPNEGNLLSGNARDGVYISYAGPGGNRVFGNLIGTDVTGTIPVPNGENGVRINAVAGNFIGGTTKEARNLISGNTLDGVLISGSGATGNFIQGNYIGTNISGTTTLANLKNGVEVNGVENNVIGGVKGSTGNLVSGNTWNGVLIAGQGAFGNQVLGNFIGTDISGTVGLPNSYGVLIYGAGANSVGSSATNSGNLISGNTNYGIFAGYGGTGGNTIQGNFLGTDYSGTTSISNGASGIRINGLPNNLIGGTVSGSRNLISGNGYDGVFIDGSGATANQVAGNYIGTNFTGTAALPNLLNGVEINGVPNNFVGGSTANSGNLISGNTWHGVLLKGSGATGNKVLGNSIGTKSDGTTSLGNKYGVFISEGASNNLIGGTNPQEANNIAFNSYAGVALYPNSTACPAGVSCEAANNKIRGNSIFSNSGLGIDLGNNGVTSNDLGDSDPGLNNLQNYPVLNSAAVSSNSLLITGTLNSLPNSSFTLDLYANNTCNSSGYGEGKSYLGSIQVTTDNNGNSTFTFIGVVPAGNFINTTTTDSTGNTSEFSKCLAISR